MGAGTKTERACSQAVLSVIWKLNMRPVTQPFVHRGQRGSDSGWLLALALPGKLQAEHPWRLVQDTYHRQLCIAAACRRGRKAEMVSCKTAARMSEGQRGGAGCRLAEMHCAFDMRRQAAAQVACHTSSKRSRQPPQQRI